MNDAPSIEINGRIVGPGHPVYVIAELSANHRQDFEEAVRLVRAAHAAGADAVKLQTYTPDTITMDSDAPPFRHGEGSLWEGKTLYQLYGEAYMPWDWQPRLKELAASLGVDLFSSPFDPTAVDFLVSMDMPAFKIASFELVDLPLIRRVATTGKPVIISTGMGTYEEIEEALATAREAGAAGIALLKCTSAYPAPPEEANLSRIPHMQRSFGVPVGLSDHTTGIVTPVAAVALGACIVEKHFTLSRSVQSPDAAFSLEPDEFTAMVAAVHTAEREVGTPTYEPTAKEMQSRGFRRSLFVVEDVHAGEAFSERNVRSIRPAGGLHTRHYEEILGRRAACEIARGTPLCWDLVAPGRVTPES